MRHVLPFLVLVLGLATVVPVLVLQGDRGPFDRSPVGTEQILWNAARDLHDGATSGPTPTLDLSLYPRLLAPIAGDSPTAVRSARRIQSYLALPALGLLVFFLMRRRAGAWPAVAAGLAAAASGSLVVSAGALNPALPASLLILFALLLVDGRSRIPNWILAGILIGISARFDAVVGWSAILLTVVLGCIHAIRSGRDGPADTEGVPRRKRVTGPVLGAVAWLVTVAGLSFVGAGDSLLPGIDGIEVYRGHRVGASGFSPRRADADSVRWWSRPDFLLAASGEAGRRLSPEETESFWLRRGIADGFRRPDRELLRTGWKLVAAFQADPVAEQISPAFLVERAERPGLGVSLWIGRILLPLGFAGLILLRGRVGWPVWAAAFTAPLAFGLTYATPGPQVVTAAALAAGVGLFVAALVGGRLIPALVVGAAAVGVLGFLVPPRLPGAEPGSYDSFTLGSVFDQEGRGSAAMREYDRALRQDPSNPFPRLAIGWMLARDQVGDEAIKELEELRVRHPRNVQGLESLVNMYQLRARWREAITIYQDLMRIAPWNPEYPNNLGTVYLRAGFLSQARAAFEQALAIDPDYNAARQNLDGMTERGLALDSTPTGDTATVRGDAERVVAMIQAGRLTEADSVLAIAYERWGPHPSVRFVDATLRLQKGDCAGSAALMEELRPRMGNNPFFLNNLGVAYMNCGQVESAIGVWEEALRIDPNNELIRGSLEAAKQSLENPGGN